MRLLLISFLCARAFAAGGHARITVHVADTFGNRVPADSIMLIAPDGNATQAVQGQVFDVAYGTYTAKVRVRGFSEAVEMFKIDQPEQILSVAMKLGVMEVPPPLCSIAGHVPTEDAISRVRVLELYGNSSRDVPVGNGTFRLENLTCGDYVLLAISEKGCVSAKVSRATVSGTTVDFRTTESGHIECGVAK
jgi:hypothetical protein